MIEQGVFTKYIDRDCTVNSYSIYIMHCAIAIVFNTITMSCSFILLYLDFISWLLLNKKYYSKFTSFKMFQLAYHGYSVKYKFLPLCKIEISVLFIATAVKGWGEKDICTKGVCDHQQEGKGRRWGREITLAQGCYSFGKLLCPQTEFLIGRFSCPCHHKPNGFIFILSEKSDGQLWWKWNFIGACCVSCITSTKAKWWNL